MSKKYKFSILNIQCAACVGTVEGARPDAEQIKKAYAKANLAHKKITFAVEKAHANFADATVTFTIADNDLPEAAVKALLITAVDEAGFEIVEILERSSFSDAAFRAHFFKGLLGILSGSILLGLCISGLGLPFLAMLCIAGISTLLTLFLGKETYYEAATGLFKHRRVSMDTLFSISTLMALGVSLVSLLVPWLPMMYDAALLIFGFRHIGKAIETSIKNKIEKNLSLRARAPKEVEVEIAPGKYKKTPVNLLRPNDIIIVRRGEVIPVDGLCLSESAKIYNIMGTGNPLPQNIRQNELLDAGSTVHEDQEYLRIKVEKPEAQSRLALLDQSLNQPGPEAPLERWANRLMKYFVPTVLAIALIAAIVIGTVFSPLTAIQCAIAILVSACPCTFGLITPLTVKIGIIKAAADGVRFNNGAPLQAAAEVDTVVLDLNGTLTQGTPQVSSGKKGVAATNIPSALLDYLAVVEQQSKHPFAKAIRHYVYQARKRTADDFHLEISHLDSSHHCGVIADIAGQTCIVGNKEMLLTQGFSELEIKAAEIPGHHASHVIYFARGRKIIGSILLNDPLRKDAKTTVDALKRMGKKVHLCTGADAETAKKYADLLGINTVKANCLGDSANSTANTKTKYIKELTRQGHKVAMVGDALNDLLAIKNSHLGIAVESNDSEQIIQQHAGAIITNRNNQLYLGSIVTALTIGNQTVRTIKQNLAFSLSYNMLALLALGGLLIGIGFVLNPAIGAALMVLQALFILANIYRFQQQKVKYANDAVLAETPTPEKKSSTPQIYQAFKISPQNSATLDKALLAKTPATAAPKPAPRVGKKYSYDDALHESSKGSVHVGLG